MNHKIKSIGFKHCAGPVNFPGLQMQLANNFIALVLRYSGAGGKNNKIHRQIRNRNRLKRKQRPTGGDDPNNSEVTKLLQGIPVFQGHGTIRAQQRAVKIHNKKPARFSTIWRVGYWAGSDTHTGQILREANGHVN
jgi:hypothetical protein